MIQQIILTPRDNLTPLRSKAWLFSVNPVVQVRVVTLTFKGEKVYRPEDMKLSILQLRMLELFGAKGAK